MGSQMFKEIRLLLLDIGHLPSEWLICFFLSIEKRKIEQT